MGGNNMLSICSENNWKNYGLYNWFWKNINLNKLWFIKQQYEAVMKIIVWEQNYINAKILKHDILH